MKTRILITISVILSVGLVYGQDHSAAKKVTASSEKISLGNCFVPGNARRYRVVSTTTQSTGAQESENKVIDKMVKKRPEVPDHVSRIIFVEEERCHGVDANGLADIGYGLISFEAMERQGETKVLDLKIRDRRDIKKVLGTPKFISVAALMEGSIRFRIDPKHRIKDLKLPRKIAGPMNDMMIEEYRKNLETRYQAFFPEGPVAPGDSWTRDITSGSVFWMAGSDVPDAKLICRAKFAGVELLRGKRCGIIEVELNMAIPKDTVLHKTAYSKLLARSFEGKSRIHFSIEDGTPIQERTKVAFKLVRRVGTRATSKIDTPLETRQVIRADWVETRTISSKVPAKRAGAGISTEGHR